MSTACATPTQQAPPPAAPAQLIVAAHREPPYLNVSIAAFTNENLGKGGVNRIYAPIREAETSYLPVLLRNTLDDAGHWGAVRVSPLPNPSAEVQVMASILASTALALKLHVQVKDSRGVKWLDKVYDARARPQDYAGTIGDDVFQPLFDRIANDMYRVKASLGKSETADLLRASMLRYAVSLSPQSFSRYLDTDRNGVIQVVGLPAPDNQMYTRVRKIRAAEYKFEDVMDEQYSAYYDKLRAVYPSWQRYSYELLHYNNRINATGSKSDETRRAGTWAATEDVYQTFKEYKLNEDELRALATTFKTETHRTAAELEGRVIELDGPLEDQYRQWRKLLDQIYAAER